MPCTTSPGNELFKGVFCIPWGAAAYPPSSKYTRLFQYPYAVRPATVPLPIPSSWVVVTGWTARLIVCEKGYCQAGRLFHGSCTLGLLLALTPHVKGLSCPRVVRSAKRMSVLSQPIESELLSYVIWMKPPN